MRPRVQIVLCVILGIVTTVGIAWASSLQTVPGMVSRAMTWRHRNPDNGEGTGWVRTDIMEKPGWRSTMSQATGPGTYKFDHETDASPEHIASSRVRRLTMPWLDGQRSWPQGPDIESFFLNEYGWPFKSLYAVQVFERGASTWRSCWEIPGWFARRPLGLPPGLPVGVAWDGLAADTVLWGSAWWLVIGLPFIARRWLRIRRGHCLNCGYDTRALPGDAPCPECGNPVRQPLVPLP